MNSEKEINMRTKETWGETKVVTLTVAVYQDLARHLEEMRSYELIDEVVNRAVQLWLKTAREQCGPAARPAPRGYLWKKVFLPSGTHLRTCIDGETRFAVVEDDRILHAGAPTTPSRFANACGPRGRNAWRNVWLLFPGDVNWVRAEQCREHNQMRELFRSVDRIGKRT
ncbi:MAG TPA: hypothetical protein VFF16_01280 [Telluria sp.]|nr:hypothetical protein [Telluria sp.]